MTRTQRRAWSAWAKSNKVLLDDESLRFVSGRKAMTMVVRNRTVAGEATNPSVVPAPVAWLNGALSLRDAGPFTVNMGFIGFRLEQNLAAATKWFVWATPPLDGNAVNPQAQLRFIKCMALPALAYDELTADIGPNYLPVWGANVEKHLGGADPFVAGGKLHVVDIKLYMVVRWFAKGTVDHIPATIFAPQQKLTRLYEAVGAHPSIVSWYAR